jgi:acetyl-CoA acyltransferase
MVDDVIMGCVFPNASEVVNIARQCSLSGGLPPSVPAAAVNRFGASGLQAIAQACERILARSADIIIAGGVESISRAPINMIQSNSDHIDDCPQFYTDMGLAAENAAEKYGISRKEQDAFAYRSHRCAIEAWDKGRFEEQIVPLEVDKKKESAGSPAEGERFLFEQDEGPHRDISEEKLAKLPPIFKKGGTVTVGNSAQMNDAAAAVMVMSRVRAAELGLEPIARYIGYSAAGVPPEAMGIGPLEAIPRVLKHTGIEQNEIDLIELNETFAAPSLAVIHELDLDEKIVNVNGGAIAVGHPLGCTGAKLTTQIIYEMQRRDSTLGMVTMCVGGGMGAAGIFENMG